MAGYVGLKSLSLRDRSWTRPPLLIAWAREPSSLSSYIRPSPSGSFSARCQEHRFDEMRFDLLVHDS